MIKLALVSAATVISCAAFAFHAPVSVINDAHGKVSFTYSLCSKKTGLCLHNQSANLHGVHDTKTIMSPLNPDMDVFKITTATLSHHGKVVAKTAGECKLPCHASAIVLARHGKRLVCQYGS